MSRVSAILLSSLILIQSIGMSFDDFFQIDEFIEHAQFHKNEHGDDFVTFLSKHYGEQKIEHSKDQKGEQKEHEQLPFHYHGYIHTFIALITLQSEISYDQLEWFKETETIFYYQHSTSSLHKKSLLQPPKQI